MIKCNRPKIPVFVSNCYRSLIENCWCQNPDERLSFDSIVQQLKTNSNFITKTIRKVDFDNYVEFIGKSQLSLDFTQKVLKLDEFIKSKSKICEEDERRNQSEDSQEEEDINEEMKKEKVDEMLNEKIDEKEESD